VGRINVITQVLPRGGNLEGLWSESNLGGDTNPHGGIPSAPVQNISTSFRVSAPSGKTQHKDDP